MATILRWYIKSNSKKGVNTLLVPEIDEHGGTSWKKSLIKTKYSASWWNEILKNYAYRKNPTFAIGQIIDAIWPYGNNNIVDKILDGTVTLESLGVDPCAIDIEFDALLTALQYATTPTGGKIPQMKSIISLEEYKQLFGKTSEITASSSSKTHMGHYIASCKRYSIAMLHLVMMNIPFQYGFPLDRWLHSLQCMLQKKIGHISPKWG